MARRQTRSRQAIAGNLMLAPLVAAMRVPLIARESGGFSPLRGESLRAVTEKVAAAREGLVQAQLSYARSLFSFWPEVMSGKVPSVWTGAAAEQAMNAALAPAGRRVKANYKRLSRSS